jgi:hypothetical protein
MSAFSGSAENGMIIAANKAYKKILIKEVMRTRFLKIES